MLTQAKTIVWEQESKLQDGLEEAKKRIKEFKLDARVQYRKVQFNGTKTIFDAAANTEPKIIAILDNERLPQTPIHEPIRQRIERFNTPVISDYDTLNSKKIVKAIKGLNTWNLLKVDRREKLTKNRKTIFQALNREFKRKVTVEQ